MAIGAEFNFAKLIKTFLIPLIVSPLMAAVLSYLLYILLRFIRRKSGINKKSCVCITETSTPIRVEPQKLAMEVHKKVSIIACNNGCEDSYDGRVMGISAQKVIDSLHYLSAGIVSFARGLNDTPKIVGLLVIINAIDIKWGMIAIAVIMAIGGLLNAKKVGINISKKITPMNSGQGLTANMITGLLVTTASVHGLPVSTTHVSVGSIFGIGTATKKANGRMISKILLSWVLTLPIAALVSAGVFKILEYFL